MSPHYCINVKNLLRLERRIIDDHIAEHKWCNHIPNQEQAIADFVHKFAWLIREIYCGYMCVYRYSCGLNRRYRDEFLDPLTMKDFQNYITYAYGEEDAYLVELKIHVIKKNLDIHKYLNKIDTYDHAVKDFLNKFGWLIFDLYKAKTEEEPNATRRNDRNQPS